LGQLPKAACKNNFQNDDEQDIIDFEDEIVFEYTSPV
jgi:predicted DNA binding CopG/RHH family protein